MILGSIIAHDTTPPRKALILLCFIFRPSNDLIEPCEVRREREAR